MYRVKKSVLINENNKFLYQYKAFTGIVFNVVDQQILDIFECKEGVRIADYYSQFISRNNSEQCIDYVALVGENADDFEPFLYQGERYTGLYYEFDEDFCVTESRCINGVRWEEAGWSPTGELESFSTSYGDHDIYQSYDWYKNNFLGRFYICNSKSHQTLEIEFTEKQEITSIDISIDYLNTSPEFEHHLRYHYLIGYTLVEDARIAPRLFASGLGVNDQFFSELQSCAGFNKMETLLLYTTSISTESLLSLENHPTLKSISVNDEREDIIQATRELKLRHPNCAIELNDIEI